MKTITCSALGGPCEHSIEGATKEEFMHNAMEHVKAAHPEMVEGIEKMTPEENAAWTSKFDGLWDAAPEEAETPAAM